MALSCAVKPDHSTVAPFVGKLQERIEIIFSVSVLIARAGSWERLPAS